MLGPVTFSLLIAGGDYSGFCYIVPRSGKWASTGITRKEGHTFRVRNPLGLVARNEFGFEVPDAPVETTMELK